MRNLGITDRLPHATNVGRTAPAVACGAGRRVGRRRPAGLAFARPSSGSAALHRKLRLATSLLATLLLASCVGQKGPEPGPGPVPPEPIPVQPTPTSLNFSFTNNPQGVNRPGEVGGIKVYVFDQTTGQLRQTTSTTTAGGSVTLDAGTYTFVCFASGAADLAEGGYLDARMTDPANHTYSAISTGSTTLGEFRLMLDCTELPAGSLGELVPRNGQFDDLFYAMTRNVTINAGDASASAAFDFIRNTNKLKISVNRDAQLFVTAPHELYTYDNRLAPYARRVRFELPAGEGGIKVQRLEATGYEERPVLLHVVDPVSGVDLLDPINVTESILDAEDEAGNHIYQTQADIDRQYEFDMDVELESPPPGDESVGLSVSITVNGFKVVDPGAVVGPWPN